MEIESNYMPIQTLDIGGETELNFDLYVNLPLNNKMILFRRKGSRVESEKLHKLSDHNVANFFVRKEEYNNFVKYVALRIKDLVGSPHTDTNLKVMTSTARAILSSTFKQDDPGMVKALMQNLNDITGVIIDSVLETSGTYNKKTFLKLAELAQSGSDFQKHPVNVTSLCVLMCFGIGYNSSRVLSDVAMGALLHDVGLAKLPTRVIAHAHEPLKLSINEREMLYRHPKIALDVLEERGIKASPLTQAMILQHHEQFNGSGYPSSLRGFQLNEMSMLLRLADEMDLLVKSASDGKENLKHQVTLFFDRMHQERVIEPILLSRVRNVIL